MKRRQALAVLGSALSHGTLLARPLARPFSEPVNALFDLPESQIDTGRAALLFGREIYPHIDVDEYSRRIDVMAQEASRYVTRYSRPDDPETVVRALNTYYYKGWGVRYDKSPAARTKRRNWFVHHILDAKEGNCVTIPMLYMAFAQRLGYPVYGVEAPEHMFVRFVHPQLKMQNIELSSEAGAATDAHYAYTLNISDKAIRNGVYLRTLTRRDYLAILIMQNALAISEQGDEDRSIRYLEYGTFVDPRNALFLKNLSAAWVRKAWAAKSPAREEECARIGWQYYSKAIEMGWTQDPDGNVKRTSK